MIRRHRFGFRGTCFELATDLKDLLDFWVCYTDRFQARGEPELRYRATVEGGPLFTGPDGVERRAERPEDLFPMLEGAFLADLIRVAGRSGPVVHAAGIASGTRAAIYLGTAGAGKSTISVELVRQGGVFLGDDTVLLEGDEVVALPRPITFAAHEQPAELLPGEDEPFEAFGYDYVDREGSARRALCYLPRDPLPAAAGQGFELGDVFLLERGEHGPPFRRLLEGAELRARLALARVRSEP